jgi:hypothetical protein
MTKNNKVKNFAFTKRNHSVLASQEKIVKEKTEKEKKKLGRPKKSLEERKKPINISLTILEIEKLEKERLALGFPSLPSYIRMLMVKKGII